VPEEVFFDILKTRLAQPDVQQRGMSFPCGDLFPLIRAFVGWLLDGFPRNRAQVDLMNKNGLIPDKFLFLSVPDDVAVARMSGRRTDPVTGKIYHMVFNPPPADPEIRKRLVHRSDDSEEKARVRVAGYHKNMDDAPNWYPAHKLVTVDALKSEAEVYADIKKALDPVFKA
jgi:adenylate kinase